MHNTPADRLRVTCARHITVNSPPADWQQRAEFANFANASGQLCGFVLIERTDGGKYLTSTVY